MRKLFAVIGILAALGAALVSANSVVVLNDSFDVSSSISLYEYHGGDFTYHDLLGSLDGAEVHPSAGGRLYLVGPEDSPVLFEVRDINGLPFYFDNSATVMWDIYGGAVGALMVFGIQDQYINLENTRDGFRLYLPESVGISPIDIEDTNRTGVLMVDVRYGYVRVFWDDVRLVQYPVAEPAALLGITAGCQTNSPTENTICVIFRSVSVIGRYDD